MNDEIKEGFLCPICLQDLKSPTNLSSHFEDVHQDEKHIVAQLRSVFGKAKRKILKQPEIKYQTENPSESSILSYGTTATGGIDISLWDSQKIGQFQSHFNLFSQHRKNTIERQVVELNKLLIRLEKLMKSGIYCTENSNTLLPNVLKARKNLERQVVPWESDKGIEFCPHCKKKFSLTYRRHHCRLCGRVVCDNCLSNLNMLLPVSLLKLDETLFMKSNQSEDNGLRVCDSCVDILTRQLQLREIAMANTILLQLYEKMIFSMHEANEILPKFLKMADSLNSGETEYGFESVTETRLKLLKYYESVESISKRIQFLGTDKDKQPHAGALRLQRSIRIYASNYLAENMFTLPGLPSKEKYYENLKQKEQERVRMRVEKTNLISLPTENAQTKNEAISGKKAELVEREKKVDLGWGPTQVTVEKASDPILQQIENLKSYIQQAKEAKKFDEIKTLEENLRYFLEYKSQQQKIN
ncbi:rabenosyn-5 isoform X1 [Hydra vulgaris]|uniref:Rabenosyn-5 n=1 Tax=Hydra vulgaris TaxID=6087 RepID=T2M5U1_HYDVU|nr:rabenosyn-5 [Hydra vulgaris]